MQSTLLQSGAAATSRNVADMDLTAVQSMDFLLKNKQFYLLAQFWQQRATLAEEEVNTLKEQLSTTPVPNTSNSNAADPTTTTANPLSSSSSATSSFADNQTAPHPSESPLPNSFSTKLNSVAISSSGDLHKNGNFEISSLSPPLSENGSSPCNNNNTNTNNNNNGKMMATASRSNTPALSEDAATVSAADNHQRVASRDVEMNDASAEERVRDDEEVENEDNSDNNNGDFAVELAAKDKEIKSLVEEVKRLQTLQETHIVQIQRLEAMIAEKSRQIYMLEARLDKNDPSLVAAPTTDDEDRFAPIVKHEKSVSRSPSPIAYNSNANAQYESQEKMAREQFMANNTPNQRHFMSSTPNRPDNRMTDIHIPPAAAAAAAFLPGFPFQFQERAAAAAAAAAHMRFGDDMPHPSRLGESLIPKSDPMEAKLQEMLRYNMDKYANQNLNTLYISQRVRELLSIHNIGQRLFAKYILGLSQGTVSELLSKPKPWDKLTEKGRDSYRKMHAWICDENAVALLKSLLPKNKDFQDSNQSHMSFSDDGYPEEKFPVEKRRPASPAMKNSPPPPPSEDMNQSVEDMSPEKANRDYQEELMKIVSRGQGGAFPSGGMPPAFKAMKPDQNEVMKPDPNVLMALHAYHQKMAEFQQNGGHFQHIPGLLALQQLGPNVVHDLSVKKDDLKEDSSSFSFPRPTSESATPEPSHTPHNNTILPPSSAPSDDFPASNPLQKMASITNSLMTQPPVAPHHNQPQKPTKSTLPPITQKQFDKYNTLNTDDVVRRIRDALSQYSISQRLFGESVLGLSQGSVSDLLARPKPWHMLTQKGREPFIRMKMFLEDENAVHKLVASQYKIAPEKLMRTGNYSGNPQMPHGIKMEPHNPMQKIMNDWKVHEQQHIMQQMQAAQAMAAAAAARQQQSMAMSPVSAKKPTPVHSPQQGNVMRNGMHQQASPTVYEMAALTQDLDTQSVTTRIKETLLANNIGQKIFGEAVLGLSQGSVSELLSKPKPWHMLSIKGREPFIRMHLWLSDANNVDRLQDLRNERREASKRRRSQQDNVSDTSSNDTADFYTTSPAPGSVGSGDGPPNKKHRVLFTEEQKEALRLAFTLDPYPNVNTIEFLAGELGLPNRTVTNWFHNHRMRLKQQVPHGQPVDPIPSRENTNCTPLDPVQFRMLLNQRFMELQKERMGLNNVPMQYLPFIAANPNFAALMGQNLLPHVEQPNLQGLINAFKDQMSGLDLSVPIKPENFDDDGHMSNGEGDGDNDHEGDNDAESMTDNQSGVGA